MFAALPAPRSGVSRTQADVRRMLKKQKQLASARQRQQNHSGSQSWSDGVKQDYSSSKSWSDGVKGGKGGGEVEEEEEEEEKQWRS